MNVKFTGVLPAQSVGDTVTKVEVALAAKSVFVDGVLSYETADQAVAAGRKFDITNSTEIANFLATGTIKVDLPVVQSRRIGWHTATIDVGATTSTVSIDGIVLHTGTFTAKAGQVLRIQCTTQNSDAVVKTAYFKNLRKGGVTIDDLTGTLTSAATSPPNWNNGSALGTTLATTAPDGTPCTKLTTNGSATGSVAWDKFLDTSSVGVYEVDFYDTGEVLTLIQFVVYDVTAKTNNISAALCTASTAPSGWRLGSTGITTSYFGFLSACTPSIRLTESRGGVGASVGAWVSGSPIVPVAICAPTSYTGVGANNSVVLTWVAPTVGTIPAGYYVYRSPDVAGVAGTYSYLGYVTGLTYTDSTAVSDSTYWYYISGTDTNQEVNTRPLQRTPPYLIYDSFTGADNSSVNNQMLTATSAGVTANAKISIQSNTCQFYLDGGVLLLTSTFFDYSPEVTVELTVPRLPTTYSTDYLQVTLTEGWLAQGFRLTGSTLMSYKFDGSTEATIDKSTGITANDVIKVVFTGNTTVTFYRNGSVLGSGVVHGFSLPSSIKLEIRSFTARTAGNFLTHSIDTLKVYR